MRSILFFGVAALTFVALWAAVQADSALVQLDAAAVRLLHRIGSEDVTALATGLTELGATQTVLLVGAVAAGSLLLRGQTHAALSLTFAVGGTQAIVFGIKELVARARPPASTSFIDAAGHAFPSAHAASSVALYGLLAVLVLRRVEGSASARAAAVALTVAGVGVIGLTRIYLGAHYPSDVLAGWLVGAVVAAAAWQLARSLRDRVLLGAAPA